jgi:hypothetical protein
MLTFLIIPVSDIVFNSYFIIYAFNRYLFFFCIKRNFSFEYCANLFFFFYF